jgi:ubiquinone biosynthesis protein
MANVVSNIARLLHAGFVLARYDAVVPADQLSQAPWYARAVLKIAKLGRVESLEGGQHNNLTVALTKLGPSYIKLGQFLATRPDIIGAKRAFQLKVLQDRLPAFGDAEARAIVERELGRSISELFTSFGPAIAAASIAQVHKAITPEGKTVAVKILRPDVERRFGNDISSFGFAARMIELLSTEGRRLRPVSAVAMLKESMNLELDLRMEASAVSEVGENSKEDPGFRVPQVDWTRSAKRVLTTEWIDGTPMADVPALKAKGYDLNALADTVIQSFLRHAIRDGFFHADMHQGNLIVDPQGTLVALDFGITGRLSEADRMFLAEILYGFITRDYFRIAKVHFDAGYIPDTQNVNSFAQALRAIGEPIMGLPADQISMGRLITQLFEVTEQFQMQAQPQLLLLQKTMVVAEGVARTLNPNLNMWKAGEPVVRYWIERKLGPLGKIEQAGGSVLSLARLGLKIPAMINDAHKITRKLTEIANTPTPKPSRWHTPALLLGVAALIVIAAQLVLK